MRQLNLAKVKTKNHYVVYVRQVIDYKDHYKDWIDAHRFVPELCEGEEWDGEEELMQTRAVSKEEAVNNILHRLSCVTEEPWHGYGYSNGYVARYWKVLGIDEI